MKGIAPLAIAMIGAIVIVTAVLMILLPIGFLRLHVIQTVERVYEYDNAQSYLLTLLSKTHDGKPVYTQISNNLQIGSPDISFVKNELDTVTSSKCYKLSSSSATIAIQEGCTPTKYSAEAKIVLPYNPDKLTEKLNLVVD